MGEPVEPNWGESDANCHGAPTGEHQELVIAGPEIHGIYLDFNASTPTASELGALTVMDGTHGRPCRLVWVSTREILEDARSEVAALLAAHAGKPYSRAAGALPMILPRRLRSLPGSVRAVA